MSRNLTRTVTLEDGARLTLTANMNTFADYEELTGKRWDEIDSSMTAHRARLWAFLHEAQPDMTPRDVGALLAPGTRDFDALIGAIGELGESMSPPKATEPTGEPSA